MIAGADQGGDGEPAASGLAREGDSEEVVPLCRSAS